MKSLNIKLDKDKSKPAYQRIAAAVREAIQSDQVVQGEVLPSARDLAESLGVHRHTVMAALNELIAEGWILSQERSSYRVNSVLPSRYFSPLLEASDPSPSVRHRWQWARPEIRNCVGYADSKNFKYRFLSGTPDLRLFPFEEFRSCLSDSLKRKPELLLGYGDSAGHAPFIKELEIYLRRIRGISDREIVVTHGSQEGIYLTAQVLIAPGDQVAVEALGYRPAWNAFLAAGGALAPVELDHEGVIPDALERVLRKNRPKLIYLTPLHQYPTTVTLSVLRRKKVYELAQRYQVPILEDDYDHEFHYKSQPLPPLASADPAGLVVYVSTFSKILFPGARLGFLAVSPEFAGAIKNLKRVTTRQNDSLLQDAVARWMRAGAFEMHLRKMRRTYEERRNCLLQTLEAKRAQGFNLSWLVPDGGMALWLNLASVDADWLVEQARKKGVQLDSGSRFQLSPVASQFLRLGFANQSPTEITKGCELFLEPLQNL